MNNKQHVLQKFCPNVNVFESYKAVILDGGIIQDDKTGTTICDLRYSMREYKNNSLPLVQVYQYKSYQEREYNVIFKNINDALNKYFELIK